MVLEVLRPWLSSIVPGTVVVDTTTSSPEHSQQIGELCRANGATYLDAPVSGSSEQTLYGKATVMVSGPEDAFHRCGELWPLMGQHVFYVGRTGNASRMKLVSNLVLGLNRAALAEGLVLADALGIPQSTALEVLKGSAAYSRQMDTKGEKMIQRDYSAQARLSQHLKDVWLMLESGRSTQTVLPLTAVHEQLLQTAQSLGFGDSDNSAVIEAIRHMSSRTHTCEPWARLSPVDEDCSRKP